MSENENEAAAAQPSAEGAAGAVQGGIAAVAAREGADGQVGKQLTTAFVSVTAVVGGIGGASAFVVPIAQGGMRMIVATVALIIVLALLYVGGKWLNERYEKPFTTSLHAMAGIVATAFALGAVGSYLFFHRPPDNPGGGSGSGSTASASATASLPVIAPPSTSALASTAGCGKPLTITSPADGTKVVGAVGVKVDITACGLTAGESAWLFDYDVSSGTYGLDGDGGPLLSSNQTMTFDDTPIGSPGDVNEYTNLTLVFADSDCNTALNGMDLENIQPTSLPQSCQIASQVEIVETW